MQKHALGAKLTTAFKSVAGKTREAGQKAIMGGKRKLTSVPYMFKGANLKRFAREVIRDHKA